MFVELVRRHLILQHMDPLYFDTVLAIVKLWLRISKDSETDTL